MAYVIKDGICKADLDPSNRCERIANSFYHKGSIHLSCVRGHQPPFFLWTQAFPAQELLKAGHCQGPRAA
jgi:hypothetical protein